MYITHVSYFVNCTCVSLLSLMEYLGKVTENLPKVHF